MPKTTDPKDQNALLFLQDLLRKELEKKPEVIYNTLQIHGDRVLKRYFQTLCKTKKLNRTSKTGKVQMLSSLLNFYESCTFRAKLIEEFAFRAKLIEELRYSHLILINACCHTGKFWLRKNVVLNSG